MENRRQRHRHLIERENANLDKDYNSNAYNRSLVGQSCIGRIRISFHRTKKFAPIIYNLLILIFIVSLALGFDIYYISNNHSKLLSSIEEKYSIDVKNLEAKYKSELEQLSLETLNSKDEFLNSHADHSKDMRKKQKMYLENVVGDLNERLKDLVESSDQHWDDHDKYHHGDGDEGGENDRDGENSRAGGRARN